MKKILAIATLFFAAVSLYAGTFNYKCGIKSVSYEDQSTSEKNVFIITLTHTAKNTSEYNKTDTYDAEVKLYLTSKDGTLEGTYTTDGFVSIGSTYDQDYINIVSTSVNVVGKSGRRPHKDYVSTFVINKLGENLYSVGECTLYVTDNQLNPTHLYKYNYSYDVKDIQTQGIGQTPFVFGVVPEGQEVYTHYDMTVTGVDVRRDDTDYNQIRYFLTLTCTGKERETNAVANYEVQLAIYPQSASIVGTFATKNSGMLLYASNSYVKEIIGGGSTTRNISNEPDSISSIQIKSKGTNKYSFYGGTLICTIEDFNYSAVYGKKRIAETKYYHFSDNGGEGIEFGYDESNTEVKLTASKVEVAATANGFDLTVTTKNENSLEYTAYITIDGSAFAGTHKLGETLSAWTKISRGSNDYEAGSGSIVYIVSKGGNKYSISATILADGYTYTIPAFDFTYGSGTGLDAIVGEQPLRKVFIDGVLYLEMNGKLYNLQGAVVR